ncbi:hypothetical protein ACG3SL_18185 [Sphingomonas sp. CJ20]
MPGAAILWLACAMGAGAVGVLRHAWALPHRSTGWNTLGWALMVASVVAGWQAAGAWGVSVAALVTTGAAFVALAVAGLRAPPARAAASNRRVGMLPQPGEPRRIGRRVATFLLVIPGGLIAALALCLAVRTLGLWSGWGEANAVVAALYTVPLVWAGLATALLMQARRRTQIATLLACVAAGAPFLIPGAIA